MVLLVRNRRLEIGVLGGVGWWWSPSSAMPLILDPLLLAAVLAGSVLLGLAVGAYPAWQAAHVEVLEVLRNE